MQNTGRRREAGALVLALGVLGATGCATSTGVAELVGVRWRERSRDRATPLGDLQTEAEVRSGDDDPLRLDCTVRTRHERERLTDESWTYTPARRLVMGAFALGEAAVSAWALLSGVDGDPTSTASYAVGATAGVDALATALAAAFVSEGYRVEEIDVAGRWTTTHRCPPGLALERGGRRLAVDAGGRLAADDQRWLEAQLVEQGGALRVALGVAGEDVWPPQAQRCAWARQRAHPAVETLCPRPLAAPAAALPAAPWRLAVTLRVTTAADDGGAR